MCAFSRLCLFLWLPAGHRAPSGWLSGPNSWWSAKVEGAWVPEWLRGTEFPLPPSPISTQVKNELLLFKLLYLKIVCYLTYPILKTWETRGPNLGSWNLGPYLDNPWSTCLNGFPRAVSLPMSNIIQWSGQRKQLDTSFSLNLFSVWIFTVKCTRLIWWFLHF